MLNVRNVTKRFGGLVAVNNVSFDISRGEILGLIGPNGSGKTTLFNVLSGVYQADSGTIIYKDKDITGLKPYTICKLGISRTFQLVRPFLGQTVLQNVLVGIHFGRGRKVEKELAEEEASEIIKLVGLSGKENTVVSSLRVPERKRVEVARALGTNPELLLLDEPMAGLIPSETQEYLGLITKIHDSGISIILVEHIMKAVMSISDRIIVLHHGEKIAEGPPEEIAHNSKVIEVYLGDRHGLS